MYERDLLTCEAWGAGLSPEGFAEREARLRAQAWARRTMSTWLLVDEASGAVLSSCEIFRMPSSLESEHLQIHGSSYGIASVFTEVALRGRGYATQMLSLLCAQLKQGDASIQSCVLYSDVGAPIYERIGFQARPAMDRIFLPEEGDPASGVELLGEDELRDALSLVPLPARGFLIRPVWEQIDWHLERERVYARLLGGVRPFAQGARIGNAVVFWASYYKSGELFILLAHADREEDLRGLLRAARRMARVCGLSRVVVWDHPPALPFVEGEEGGQQVARDGALPMILPLDPRVNSTAWSFIPKVLWI
jgi:RimJ/RimL family protein N-acetyltransferase